jgi:hypothetical protein
MAERVKFNCDKCDHDPEEKEHPVVFRINCGTLGADSYVDMDDPALSVFVRLLMEKQVSRIELCLDCFQQLLRPMDQLPAGFLDDIFDPNV